MFYQESSYISSYIKKEYSGIKTNKDVYNAYSSFFTPIHEFQSFIDGLPQISGISEFSLAHSKVQAVNSFTKKLWFPYCDNDA